jgi:hypothetical protein
MKTPRPLYPRYSFDKGLGRGQSRSEHGAEEKYIPSLPLPEIEPRSSSPWPSHCTDWEGKGKGKGKGTGKVAPVFFN